MRLRSIIGKRRHAAAAALCVLVVLAVAVIDLFHLRSAAAAGQRAREAAKGLNSYAYDLIFRPGESSLAVTLRLDYTNRTGDTLHDLTLRTWAGAYESEETSPAAIDALYDACYPNGFDPGGITIEGVWWQEITAEASFADDAHTVLTVPIPPLEDGQSGQMLLRCRVKVPECAHRFGHSQGVWQFGNALPVLAVYENGSWRTDAYAPIGDPFYSECANYTVTLTAPQGYVCAFTGRQTAAKNADGTQRFTIRADAARDFGFALSDSWQRARKTVNGIQVNALAPTADAAKRAAGHAANALKIFSRLYGDYPWDTFTVCAVDFPFGGMEYPGLVFVSQSRFTEDQNDALELVIAHETAHQWFYALVGSDQVSQPWQDEALCEFSLLRYALARYGRNAYDNLCITRAEAPMRERIPQPVTPATPITDFGSLDTYSAVVYGRGCAFMLAVEQMTGKADAFLRAYCDQYAFRLASRQDFSKLLNAVTGEDLTPLMIDYLDTLMY